VSFALALGATLARSRPDLRPKMGVLPKVALAAAPAAAFAWSPAPAAVDTVLALLVYSLVLVLMRAVPPELWSALRLRRGGAPAS
jgi:hypothetical protein